MANFDSGLVDFDYDWTDQGYSVYGPGPGAVGSANDSWNTAELYNAGTFTLNTADGSPSSVAWYRAGGGGAATGVTGTYANLFDVSSYFTSASISGLTPNAQYNLYLYNAYWGETIAVNGTDFTTPGKRFGSVNSLLPGSDYDTHTVTADSSGMLTLTPVSAQFNDPSISSWQLSPVPVPEPTSISLVAIALTAALLAPRRR